jgi:hypothetical protein
MNAVYSIPSLGTRTTEKIGCALDTRGSTIIKHSYQTYHRLRAFNHCVYNFCPKEAKYGDSATNTTVKSTFSYDIMVSNQSYDIEDINTCTQDTLVHVAAITLKKWDQQIYQV